MEILKRLKKYPKSGPKMTWNIMLQMCLALCWRKSSFCERRNHPGGISLTWKNYENWIDLASSSSGMGGIVSVIEMCFNAYITSACKHTHTPKKTSTHTSIASMRRAKLEKRYPIRTLLCNCVPISATLKAKVVPWRWQIGSKTQRSWNDFEPFGIYLKRNATNYKTCKHNITANRSGVGEGMTWMTSRGKKQVKSK